MEIFVTGASGYIGNGVAKAFARAGHKVTGLVRQESAAKELQRNEITPLIGQIDDLAKQAKGKDVIVHCAFESPETDAKAVDYLLQASPKTFVYTSGVWVYGNRKEQITEKTLLKPLDLVKWRPAVENKALQNGGIVIRPGHVYGYGKGLMAMIFDAASRKKLEIPGNGENYWPIIHLEDLSNLYLLSVEKGLKKTILNGTEEKSIPLNALVEAVAQLEKTKVVYLASEKAFKKFGPLAEGLLVDQPNISSSETQALLDWHPRHNDLLLQIDHYWKTFKAC